MVFKNKSRKVLILIGLGFIAYIFIYHRNKMKAITSLELTYGNCINTSTSTLSENVQSLSSVEVNLTHSSTPTQHDESQRERMTAVRHFLNVHSVVKVNSVDCSALFRGSSSEMKKAEKYHSSLKYSESQEMEIITETTKLLSVEDNCKSYLIERGYALYPSCVEEEEFPIAYSILIYKDFRQVERLIRAIYRPQNFYCIHVDSNSRPEFMEAVQSLIDCLPGERAFISPIRREVKWGTFTVLQPELDCLKELWNRFVEEVDDLAQKGQNSSDGKKEKKKKPPWKYFINLTGQEFPLRTNLELVRILKIFNGSNNLEATRDRMLKSRLKHYQDNPAPNGLVIWKGSIHIVVRREFVDFVLHHPVSQALVEFLKSAEIPDEYFFSTLNNNPKFEAPGSYTGSKPETDTTSNRFIARFKNWGGYPFGWPCKGRWVRSVCHFGVGDLPLLASRDELFANKFDYMFEPLAYDCMEELHMNRTREEFSSLIGSNSSEDLSRRSNYFTESQNSNNISGSQNINNNNNNNSELSKELFNRDHQLFPDIDFTSYGDKDDGGFTEGAQAEKLSIYLKWIRPWAHKPGEVDFDHYKYLDFVNNHFYVPDDWVCRNK